MKVTAVHEPPVYYDLSGSIERGVEIIGRAAAGGSKLVVFPEAWFPGYVDFVWALTPTHDEDGDYAAIYKRLWDNASDLTTNVLAPIQEAARENHIVVVLGIQEKSGGTLYNTGVVIDADGTILNIHRKLMPTNAERTVWGFGDGSSLRVVDSAVGRIGVLLCWENYMPMARMALYAQNMEILCAPTAYNEEVWHVTMQHIGMEGGCIVVGVNGCVRFDNLPADLPGREDMIEWGEWVSPGNASIIAPGGRVLAGPAQKTQGLIEAEVDLSSVAERRRLFDVAGHYACPDVFTLKVDTRRKEPVLFT
ncbi:carbon-nitrogen hydrolase family protein [Maritimibacter dapengensis]|uniref:Carbon-nitrogen hydrolase family protein n=1 Tax=Maritimibacter dapengensis TaxID=2836868 RepID=A0ABS6T3V8_9RHOB|nr:carbon-nitrogen hydrolase family protein [Maritimibacter dapengensis]MBV7379665.1 carbon-nitrogen hydrolase family protein [Maritimibacter dapengensis]